MWSEGSVSPEGRQSMSPTRMTAHPPSTGPTRPGATSFTRATAGVRSSSSAAPHPPSHEHSPLRQGGVSRVGSTTGSAGSAGYSSQFGRLHAGSQSQSPTRNTRPSSSSSPLVLDEDSPASNTAHRGVLSLKTPSALSRQESLSRRESMASSASGGSGGGMREEGSDGEWRTESVEGVSEARNLSGAHIVRRPSSSSPSRTSTMRVSREAMAGPKQTVEQPKKLAGPEGRYQPGRRTSWAADAAIQRPVRAESFDDEKHAARSPPPDGQESVHSLPFRAPPPRADLSLVRRHSICSPVPPVGLHTTPSSKPSSKWGDHSLEGQKEETAEELASAFSPASPRFKPNRQRLSPTISRTNSLHSDEEDGTLPPIRPMSGLRARTEEPTEVKPLVREANTNTPRSMPHTPESSSAPRTAPVGLSWKRNIQASQFSRSNNDVSDIYRAAAMAAMNHTEFKVSEQYAHTRAPSTECSGASDAAASNGSNGSGVGVGAVAVGGSFGRKSAWFAELETSGIGTLTWGGSLGRRSSMFADASALGGTPEPPRRLSVPCPEHEGMLKVETFGEQRVHNLLYKQSVWVPAYSELKEGMLKCSKDRKHTIVVDAFSMLETVVEICPANKCHLELRCHTDHGDAIVELRAKTEQEALEWVHKCNLARRWAEADQRCRMGLAPLCPSAMRLVGLRKLQKRHVAKLLQECMDFWSDAVCDHQEQDARSKKHERAKPREPRQRREEETHERSVTALMPGHVRKIKVTNGKVSVGGAMSKEEQVKKDKAVAQRVAAAEDRVRKVQETADQTRQQERSLQVQKEEHVRMRRNSSVEVRSTSDLQADLAQMLVRFDAVNKGMGKVLDQVGM